ncbi:MAG: heme-binding domain-containing protein [Chitinophagaceae bacterium]
MKEYLCNRNKFSKTMLKKLLLGLLVVFISIQFIKPARNLSDDNTNHLASKYEIPENVNQILKSACYDCHSNKTEYPWYANVQPIAWMLNNHIQEGKKHLNFSTFTSLPIAVQNHKLEETIEMVEEKEMPLASYTYFGLHSQAKLSEQQRTVLIDWAKSIMNTLKTNYPPDSLIMKRRRKS